MSDGKQLRSILAANVRKIRELRGWTQDEYARRADVSRPRISEIEREAASTSIDIIEKLAKAAGVTVSALLTDGDFVPLSAIAEHLPPDVAQFVLKKENMAYLKIGMKAKDFKLTPEILDQIITLTRQVQEQTMSKHDEE